MALNFGNQLLGGYEKEYSDEFFATETEAGITAQETKTIQSVQHGSIVISDTATSNTATITAVDTDNAFVIWNGGFDVSTNAPDDENVKLTLTNATTVTASRIGTHDPTSVNYSVIEYLPGVIKSKQTGSGTDGNVTITNVDPIKSTLYLQGSTNTDSGIGVSVGEIIFAVNLASNTIAVVSTSDATQTAYFVVVELY